MAKMGRPTKYSKKLDDEIYKRISQGNSLRKVLRAEDMPSIQTFYTWLIKYPDFLEHYRVASEISHEIRLEEIDDLGYEAMADKDKAPGLKILADQRRWAASKLYPKKYGDRQALDIGGQTDNPIVINRISAGTQIIDDDEK